MGHAKIRLLLDQEADPPDPARYVVCSGLVRSRHRCLWAVVDSHAQLRAADDSYEGLDPKVGRALFVPQVDQLQFVRPDGTVVGAGVDGLAEFRREVAAQMRGRNSVPVDVVRGDGLRETIMAQPVGEHFVVYRGGDPPRAWHVTHVASGLAARRDLGTRLLAAAIAVALQRIPIPWGKEEPLALENTSVELALRTGRAAGMTDLKLLRDEAAVDEMLH